MIGWTDTTLGQLCDDGGGDVQTGPFGSQLHASDYVQDGVPSVMPTNIGDNVIHSREIARVSAADSDRLSKYRLQTGDIVYSRRGDVEKRALVRPENDGWICGTGCLRIRLGDGSVADPTFVSYALGLEDSRSWVLSHAVGATMPNLNTAILRALPISLPSIVEQRDIAKVLGTLDNKIAANVASTESCQELARQLGSLADRSVMLSELVNLSKASRAPEEMAGENVWHYSLPAFDRDGRPSRDRPSTIKSLKFIVDEPCVLISKLNPRFPRVWNIPTLREGESVASTEFVVLKPTVCSTGVLWALLSQRSFGLVLEGKVSGTSGSHQRVRPADLLATVVGDPGSISEPVQAQITSLCDLVCQLGEESARLEEVRDALIPELMSGRLSVRDVKERVEAVV